MSSVGRFRAFGSARADIELDFIHGTKLQVSLQVLESCRLQEAETFSVLTWTGSERILALWDLVWVSESGARHIELSLQCQNPACKEAMALEFSEGELQQLVQTAQASSAVPALTTQESLAVLEEGIETWFQKQNRALSLQSLDEQLQQADPLLNFSCETSCPACGQEQKFLMDLEGLALRRLQNLQLKVLFSIHQFAERYGWSEEQIFALPPWRRDFYGQLLRRGEVSK